MGKHGYQLFVIYKTLDIIKLRKNVKGRFLKRRFNKEDMMNYTTLANGVEMPMEGFGVFQVPEEACKDVVLNAIRTGYRLIDTASSYKNEEAVGQAIKEAVAAGLLSARSFLSLPRLTFKKWATTTLRKLLHVPWTNWA